MKEPVYTEALWSPTDVSELYLVLPDLIDYL